MMFIPHILSGNPNVSTRCNRARRAFAMLLIFCTTLTLPAPALSPAQTGVHPDKTVAINRARSALLGFATAMQNERFVIRDSFATISLQPQESRLISLHLIKGVDYWVIAGWSSGEQSKLRLGLYDARGNPVVPEKLAEGQSAIGARFEPDTTAPYYVRLTNTGSAPATVCMTYCYR